MGKNPPTSRLTIEHDNVALPDSLLPQGAGQHLNMVKQLLVRVPLLDPCDGAVVVDGDLLTPAGEDVPVDAVVARRDLAVREPLPCVVGDAAAREGLARPAERGGGLRVPVQVLGLVCPELVRVLEAVPQDVVLEVVVSGHGCSWGGGGQLTMKTMMTAD